MIVPVGDLRRYERVPFVTLALIAVNIVVWVAYQLTAGADNGIETIGFQPCSLAGTCTGHGVAWPAAVLTSMFGHGSWAHLVGNMLFLLVLGPAVEGRLGHGRFLGAYLLAGVGAAMLYAAVTLALSPGDARVFLIGASGAISGVVAAYLVLRPFERILLWVMPVIFVRIPAIALLGIWFLLQALQGAWIDPSAQQHAGVAFMAHVGGFLTGLAIATALVPEAWTRRMFGPGPGGGPAAPATPPA